MVEGGGEKDVKGGGEEAKGCRKRKRRKLCTPSGRARKLYETSKFIFTLRFSHDIREAITDSRGKRNRS